MDGKPIEVNPSVNSFVVDGTVDWRDPIRLRVFDIIDVGDFSRILSSSVLVLGRFTTSGTSYLERPFPLGPELAGPLRIWPSDSLRSGGEVGDIGIVERGGAAGDTSESIPLDGSGVTALIDVSAKPSG